jgi:hypothetical protein
LVKTVGILVASIGATLIYGIRKNDRQITKLLGTTSALGLATIDVTYVAKRRISPIYLLDAAQK